MKAINLVCLLLGVLAVGCGSSPNTGTNPTGPGTPTPTVLKLNGAEYKPIEKGTLESTETTVKGTGSLIFRQPRTEEDSNFALAFTLEDAGSVTLVANSDAELKNAVKLTFARQGKKLKVILKVADEPEGDLSEEFEAFAADAPLSISVDVHGHGHVIVWVGDGEEQEYAFTARVPGRLWGLVLDKATVTGAVADKAKDVH